MYTLNAIKWLPVVLGITVVASSGASAADSPRFRLSIEEFIELDCRDCDGLSLADISGNGKTDILLSEGKHGDTFWYEQGASYREWIRHPIYRVPLWPGDEKLEVEGNDLADFDGNGRLEAVSLEQRNGRIYIHRHDGDPRGEWKTAMIRDDREWIQNSLVADVDGDGRPDLIYAWEGDREGRGGVHWLKFVGTDLLDPDHWKDHVMVQLEGAWWIAQRRVDLNGNGRATDIVFTARNNFRRNPGTRPGVYWLSEPKDATRPWELYTIDDTLPHPKQVDLGDLSGDGHGKDIVVGGRKGITDIYWYSFTENWKRYAIPLPEQVNGVKPARVWNVKTARFGGDRDGILAPVTGDLGGEAGRGELMFYEFIDGQFRPNILFPFDYGHPMEDRIIFHDIDGNGLPEAFIADSGPGQDRLIILKFAWNDAKE